eukprot:840770-Amphidinium_carterae.1
MSIEQGVTSKRNSAAMHTYARSLHGTSKQDAIHDMLLHRLAPPNKASACMIALADTRYHESWVTKSKSC